MTNKIKELTQEEKEKVITLYNEGVGKGKIARILKIHYSRIKAFFESEGIGNRKRGIPQEYREHIYELYNSGLNSREIHEQYYPQFTGDQINYICRVKGITRPNGKIAHMNHNYFSVIDTPNKAYWLGLLTADGCVQHHVERGNSWSISLSLMKEDRYLVEQLAKDIETNLIVKEYNNGSGFQRQDGKPHIEERLLVYSAKMASDLGNYGVVPKKSLSLKRIADIPEELYRHYVRGFFDGNGSATYYWNKSKAHRCPRIIFYSTHEFCDSLASLLEKQLKVVHPKITDQKNEQISLFSYTNFKTIELLYDYFYSDLADDLHYCKRKRQVLEELMSEYRDNQVA